MNIQSHRKARGFSLIEVMIAVVVLAIGLLSLAALQGELFRSGAEAKARANAATIAQQVIEDARSFGFLNAPDEDYLGNTYTSLDDEDWEVAGVSGVTFAVDRDVIRYRWDAGEEEFLENDADAYAVGVPEFKLVRVNVSWTDSNGNEKSIQMADSIAAIAPADVAKVMQGPTEASRGPEFWIVPPNKDNPRVVPIAVGGDESSASSNPTPEQFIEDASAVTRFSVLSFAGDTSSDEVQLLRRLDMAAASCVCNEGAGETYESSVSNPSYKPTVWNGVLLAYEEPSARPANSPIGIADVGNDSEIEPICTVCCRDHHVTEDSAPVPDPWRSVIGDTDSNGAHYTYEPKGQGFVFDELFPSGDFEGQYLESCHLTRVNGRMRVTVDSQQSTLLTAALNGNEYRDGAFATKYSNFVVSHLEEAMGDGTAMPEGYPSPSVGFPKPSTTVTEASTDILSPADIAFTAEGEFVELVAFGMYVDYISDDTLLAYRCAKEVEGTVGNDDDCDGLRDREPLSVLPFYAVNVASIGSWSDPPDQTVIDVSNATYPQGQLDEKGGKVTAGKGYSDVDEDNVAIPTPATFTINDSNTGLAGTLPFDPDDELTENLVSDSQGFTKAEGEEQEESTNTMTVNVVSGPLNFKTMDMVFGSDCDVPQNDSSVSVCTFTSPVSSITMQFSDYNEKAKGQTPAIDRMICVANHAKILSVTETGTGTDQITVITFLNLGAVDYTLGVSVQLQGTCDLTGLGMTP